MRAYLSVLLDKPLTEEARPFFGSFTVRTSTRAYTFDFNEASAYPDTENPSLVHCALRDEDLDTFPEVEELKHHILEICDFPTCHVDMDEFDNVADDVACPKPTAIASFVLQLPRLDDQPVPLGQTKWVHGEADQWVVVYTFQPALLQTVSFVYA